MYRYDTSPLLALKIFYLLSNYSYPFSCYLFISSFFIVTLSARLAFSTAL